MLSWKAATLNLINTHGALNRPIMMEDWLSARKKASPDALALISGTEQWTYAELNEYVENCCAWLIAHIQPGRHVGVLLHNSPTYIYLVHALARLGAVLVPLNTRLAVHELQWQIDRADCQFLIYSDQTAESAQLINNKKLELIYVEDLLKRYKGPRKEGNHAFDLSNMQAIIFTSGTTGKPKGATLTYANHFWSATGSAFKLGVQQNDRWLSCLPLYHVGGLAVIFRSCLYGITIVQHERFDVAAISASLDTQEITLISLVPTMVYRLLDHRQGRPWPSNLRHLLLGGAPASLDLLDRCRALNIPISATYGLTEAASQVATSLPDQTLQKPGSVGKPLLFSSVKIIDESGTPVPSGQVGEIVVTGPTIMTGYYNDPQATAETLRHNQLFTGDIGYLDEEGDLWVKERRNNIIITGGENVYPAEIESVFNLHPDIDSSCIVGIPDKEWGQRVAAMIVLKNVRSLTPDEIIAYGRQHLAGYKVPRLIHIVDQLPQTASGKINRQLVRDSLIAMVEH